MTARLRRRGSAPVRLPPAGRGLRIGLYGGSFDPPHAGHRHVALLALKRLRLDRVWWIVTPGNPLKQRGPSAAPAARLEAARRLARHPRMAVTGFEAVLGTAFTAETLDFLRRRLPAARLVWIMGADSFAGFTRWHHWRGIAGSVPLAVVDRPGWTGRALRSPAARALAGSRVEGGAIRHLARRRPPAWAFIFGPRSNLSSTALRDRMLLGLDQH